VVLYLVVALGGALGALGRWGVEELLPESGPMGWPWATLTVNVVGAFVIGILATSARVAQGPPLLRPFLIAGVLGGFTTFSALALETGQLLEAGQVLSALSYVAATFTAGLVAVAVGRGLVRREGRAP